MELPQLIYIGLTFLGLGVSMAKHGEERSPESFWVTLIATGITYSLLITGGFFK